MSSPLRVLTVQRIKLLSSVLDLDLLTSSRPFSSSCLFEIPRVALMLLLLGSEMCTPSELAPHGYCFCGVPPATAIPHDR